MRESKDFGRFSEENLKKSQTSRITKINKVMYGRCACTSEISIWIPWISVFSSCVGSVTPRLKPHCVWEFALGMAKLNCTTIKALKTKLMARSKTTVKNFSDFEDLYMYAFGT